MLSLKVGRGKDRRPALLAFVDRAIQPALAFPLEGKTANPLSSWEGRECFRKPVGPVGGLLG